FAKSPLCNPHGCWDAFLERGLFQTFLSLAYDFFRILRFPLKERFSRLGTIDLRVDYLRPGRGNEFIATAHIIRAGSKVTVARMELHNEEGTHIAFGTGTYLVG
ncbi:thioesterase family protein, partial [Klebsiella pneumoniae]